MIHPNNCAHGFVTVNRGLRVMKTHALLFAA